jgi:hypothetical protein
MRKQTCVSCHFFLRSHRGDDGREIPLEATNDCRDLAAGGNLSWQRQWESLACHKGIWDEGVGFPGSSALEQISKLNRRNKCYFFKYQPGMLLPAAEKLQQEGAAKSTDLRNYRLGIYALAATILGLIFRLVYKA